MSEETPAAETPETPSTEEKPKLPENVVNVEEAGTLKKKVTITVKREKVDAKLNEMFGELAQSAQIPGFRVGHAPRRLIEKRFGKDITNDVRNSLVGESLGQAVEQTKLQTIGEPKLELDKVELPETGDFSFSFEVEVAPEFDLPELKGIAVTRPAIAIDDKKIDQALDGIRHSQARHEVTEDAANEGDIVLAGVKITGDGIEPLEQHGLTLRVAPGQVEGLPLMDLGKTLTGKKANDTATLTVKAPEAHANEAWRNKDLTVELTISQVRKTILPEINEEYAKALGFETLAELRQQVAKRLEGRVQMETAQQMRQQVCKYLLDNTKFDLPTEAVARHTMSVLKRRYVDLLYRGVPQQQIDEQMTALQAQAGEQAQLDLRLSFILGKIAANEKFEVSEGEINARIADMAQQQNRRPERLRQDLETEGTLTTLVDSILEEKALDKLLEQATITDKAEEQK